MLDTARCSPIGLIVLYIPISNVWMSFASKICCQTFLPVLVKNYVSKAVSFCISCKASQVRCLPFLFVYFLVFLISSVFYILFFRVNTDLYVKLSWKSLWRSRLVLNLNDVIKEEGKKVWNRINQLSILGYQLQHCSQENGI